MNGNIIYVEAPHLLPKYMPLSLFIGGGITGCPDWQAELINLIQPSTFLTVLNPRRKDFDVQNISESQKQIEWEHHALQHASAICFWFPKETLCPITLYELGAWSMTKKPIFVACEPGYKREFDVRIQTKLARNDVVVWSSLKSLADDIDAWVKNGGPYDESIQNKG